MSAINDRSYTDSHEWLLEMGDGLYRVGLTDFAQSSLGDIVYVDLPTPGDTVSAGTSFGDVESVKTVSEMISPVTGVISAVNDALSAAPEAINADPYGCWIIEVRDVSDVLPLLSAEQYDAIAVD